jgi:hypothetical protein
LEKSIPRFRRPGDVAAVAVLVALPALVFGVPALLGHAALPGDDLTQNYPLRVLAGREIRSGQLPLLDPYAWSGSALLAGWNAGAAYPLTWLFAVLPGVAAWTCGLIATWVTAGTGMFGFLRSLRLGSLASFLGALSFTLGGAMVAQVAHFGLVAGMSWVPLALLCVLKLSRSSWSSSWSWSARLGWTGLLAVSVGLLILAGEPRAIVDGFVILACYAVWQVARLGRRLLPALVSISGGALLGTCLAAAQWLPGLAAISTSQRGTGSVALFATGSLPDRWLLLTLVPDLLGGSGSLGQPGFLGDYNLSEVTSYVGVLPLVAAFALLGRARFAVAARRLPEWLIWHVLAITGIVLALGGDSPLGTILYRLPFYGGQRLQSRNILVLDFALAVLLAYWLDRPFPARARAGLRHVRFAWPTRFTHSAPLTWFVPLTWFHRRGRRARAETILGVLPPVAMIVVTALALTWGAGLLRWLGAAPAASTAMIGKLQPSLIPYLVIAAAALALVLAGQRLGPRMRARVCAAFVAADLGIFTVLGVVNIGNPPSGSVGANGKTHASASGTAAADTPAPAAGTASGTADSVTRPVSALGYGGRYAIYDPGQFDDSGLTALEQPNLNDLSAGGMPSVQGYSSIVDGTYATATGSHQATGAGQDALSPVAIGDGILGTLDTSILLTLPGYLTTTVGGSGPGPGAPGTGDRDIGTDQRTTWYLGQPVPVSRVTVPDSDAQQDAATGTEIGLMAAGGTTRWFRARAAGATDLEISVPRPVTATAVLGRAGNAPSPLGAPVIDLGSGRVIVADGQLQNDLEPPQWGAAGSDGSFAVFTDRFNSGPLTVKPLPGQQRSGGSAASPSAGAGAAIGAAAASAAGASVRYVTGEPGEVTSATVSSARGVQLVRSVAAIPGWSATWQPRHGQEITLSVRPDGIVQAVDVPAGVGTVTWHYTPPSLDSGLALSLAALVSILICALAGRRTRLPFARLPRARRVRQPREDQVSPAPAPVA